MGEENVKTRIAVTVYKLSQGCDQLRRGIIDLFSQVLGRGLVPLNADKQEGVKQTNWRNHESVEK